MGRIARVDDAGHLLAYSLGGGMDRLFNYPPQVARLNRNRGGKTPQWVHERTIWELLKDNLEDDYVDWNMTVIYNSSLSSVRPIRFCLSYTSVDDNGVSTAPNEMCFANIQTGECFYEYQYDHSKTW